MTKQEGRELTIAIVFLVLGSLLWSPIEKSRQLGIIKRDKILEVGNLKYQQKKQITRVHVLEYYKLAKVLGNCKKCQTIYYKED